MTREWDAKSTYFTLDRDGERLIVKPFGGKSKRGIPGGNPYRAWSGQGKAFEDNPVAFAFKGNTEERPISKDDVVVDLEPDLEEINIQDGNSDMDEDYFPTPSEASDSESEAQQGSVYQGSTTRSAIPEKAQGRQARPITNRDVGDAGGAMDVAEMNVAETDLAEIGLGTTPLSESALDPSPPDSSTAGPQISEVVAGKRLASDTIDNDRLSKRVHSESATTPIGAARVPPTLTAYKQEHTVLYVMLAGPTVNMVPVKLRSAMTMSTLFSSVSAAAGVLDYEQMAIAVKLGGGDGGQATNMIVKKNLMDTFEVFLEMVDGGSCWNEQAGSLTLQVQLR